MAYDPNQSKYQTENQNQHSHSNLNGYVYPHTHHTDENQSDNSCVNKDNCPQVSQQSSGTQTIQKMDAATMTDPLKIDVDGVTEYIARCSNNLAMPYVAKYDEINHTSRSCHDVRPKIDFQPPTQLVNDLNVSLHYNTCTHHVKNGPYCEHVQAYRHKHHICDICGACLKRKEHLDRHKQGHNKDRPYQCSMCCKSFKRNEHLARHTIIHTGSKTHVCPECAKAFYRKDHLKKHMLSHKTTRKNLSDSFPTTSQTTGQENLSTFSLLMRQSGPPPFSVLRT